MTKTAFYGSLFWVACLVPFVAVAEEESAGRRLFIEAEVGAGFGNADDFKFRNPVGTAFTTNPTSGDYILMNSTDDNDTSVFAGAAIGLFLNPNWYVKANYRYFGDYDATGFASFNGSSVAQELELEVHGATVAMGAITNVGEKFFVEGSVEIGAAFVDARGWQGRNQGAGSRFPSHDETNFAFGGGGGVGYHLSDSADFIIRAMYYDLGEADTGTTGATPPAGMNTGEQLQSDLDAVTLSAGIRMRF
jgi:opacity protein-like surface antigen